MPKVAVMTDTNSGVLQEEAKALGLFVVPMPFNIGEKTFHEGVDLTEDQFYEAMEAGENITTSQPEPATLMEHWDKALAEYDELVYIPMSSGLSGSCQTAAMLAEDYGGRVRVVNNQRISVTQRQSALDAKALAAQGRNAAEIGDILERDKFASSIYITLNTLYYLKKGGRITPAAAALGTILRIKPVLQIQGEKLDAFAKVRTMAQAKVVMKNAIAADLEKRFGADKENVFFEIAHTRNEEAALVFAEELKAEFGISEVDIAPLSLSIATHIGPGSLAVAVSAKVPEIG